MTGALGCLGVWTLRHLVHSGCDVVAFDLGDDRTRLHLVAGPQIDEAVHFEQGDVTDRDRLADLIERHRIERIIHLAAVQVPASHANPPLGASVNVVGTANVLDVCREYDLENVVFASSIAVYGTDLADETVVESSAQRPAHFYGVFKRADEAVARLYWESYGVQSIGLRPHTVYGPGRDTGLTSSPTWAMLAAAKRIDYELTFSGAAALQHASDVARTFIAAAEVEGRGRTYSLRGHPIPMSALAQMIMDRSSVKIAVSGDPLPFPSDFDESELEELIGRVPSMDLDRGIAETIELFDSAPRELLPVELGT